MELRLGGQRERRRRNKGILSFSSRRGGREFGSGREDLRQSIRQSIKGLGKVLFLRIGKHMGFRLKIP